MSDFDSLDDFEKPGLRPNSVAIVSELLFVGFNPDNTTAEMYESYDESDIREMLNIIENDESDLVNALFKSLSFRNQVHNEILNIRSTLRAVIRTYYSGKTRAQIRAEIRAEEENDVEFENDE